MLLIADSGSTKTHWRLVDDEKRIRQLQTEGLNPYFLSKEKIADIITSQLLPSFDRKFAGKVFFYGSGCGAVEKREMVQRALHSVFPSVSVEVHTDLLGAARALCGRESGIAAILGTGSNSCYYDGHEIKEQANSLGFILGDEGSGAHIGKTFISSLLNKELPGDMEKRFFERFHTDRNSILDAVYSKPFPSRYLATFAKFVHQNLNDEHIASLTANCFRAFFDKHVCRYPGYSKLKFHCTGSVGFYFSNILRRVAEEKNISIGKIVESPAAALVNYHLGE